MILVEVPAHLLDRIYDVLSEYMFTSDSDGMSYNNDNVIEVRDELEPYTGYSK